MDTTEFFRTVTPSTGFKIIAELVPHPTRPKPGWRYHKFETPEDASAKALALDAQGKTVYFACNGYGDWYFDEKKQKDRLRTANNVLAGRALYDDIDVGKEGCYATRREAGEALKAFVDATGVPMPTVIYSGARGLHLYWPFDRDLKPAEWLRLANKKRLVINHFGLKVDPAVTADLARVLRPVGTTWRKEEEVEVTARLVKGPFDVFMFEAILDAYIEENAIASATDPMEVPEYLKQGAGSLSDFGKDFPPSSLVTVAQHCQQIKLFATTGCDDEPTWHKCLGVAAHCEDGKETAHAWSAQYDGYDYAETQQKLDAWEAGPTTCDTFRKVNPTGCAGCAHKCKSPIQLGLDEEAAPPELPETTAPEAAEPQVASPTEDWPKGFSYNKANDMITQRVQNDDGVWQDLPVATPMFYLTHAVNQEDGTVSYCANAHIRGRIKEFMIPAKQVADDRTLSMTLSAHQVHAVNRKRVQDYVQAHANKLRTMKDNIDHYRQFGWHHDFKGFLIGDTLITETGLQKVYLGKQFDNTPELRNAFRQKGDRDSWITTVNELYNRTNAEPYQLAVCAAFGGILNPLLGYAEWKGIPMALTSDESGRGKSTACKIALSIYTQQDDALVVSDSTPKGILPRASAMNNLPFLLDEITKYLVKPEDMSDVTYALSHGGARIGLTSDGVERARPAGWNLSPFFTGNRNIMHHLTEMANKLNPEASQMRVFEIALDQYPRVACMEEGNPEYTAHFNRHAVLAREIIDNHYGVVGLEWIRFVIKHRIEIATKLREVSMKMAQFMSGGDATKERFYYHWATCTLVGGYYARKLGFINFDLNNLRRWVVAHVDKLRQVVHEQNNSPEDVYSAMMADFNGRIIVTKHFDKLDKRSNTIETPLVPVNRNPISGRYVLGDEKERPKLYVTTAAISQWCKENGVQYARLRREWEHAGILRFGTPGCNRKTGAVKVAIGKGVVGMEQLRNPRCWELNAELGSARRLNTPADVVNIKPPDEEAGEAVS